MALTPEQTELWNKTLDELINFLKQRLARECIEPDGDELRAKMRAVLQAIRAERE